MEIKKTAIKIKDLCEGYVNETETDVEQGVYAYGGKLCVRPAFQRSFVYDTKQANAVIDTALKGFPLNIMYWVDNGDGTYDCLDGQQRTISLCNFVDGSSSFKASWFKDNAKTYVHTLKRIDPDLYEKFMDYELEVYICKGTKAEQMEWFRTINIAGEELTSQELRNVNYVSPWLTDAKKYFSKADSNLNKKCPAQRVGGKYTDKNANRQEILEQVISWRAGSKDEEAICQYMEDHINDADASDLWNYFNDVINWVKSIFVGDAKDYEKDVMKKVEWGFLYNQYKETNFIPEEIDDLYHELLRLKGEEKIKATPASIIKYCITKDRNLIELRAFTEPQRLALFKRQDGICPDCGKPFDIKKMQAHHVQAWADGGTTELDNGVMLCEKCHKKRHNY